MTLFLFITTIGSLYYLFILYFTNKRLIHNSHIIKKTIGYKIKNIQEACGSIKDIILDKTHKNFINNFDSNERKFRYKFAENQFINSFPRYAIESFGLAFITLFSAFILNSDNTNLNSSFGTLGAIIIGLQNYPTLHLKFLYPVQVFSR